MVPLFKTLIRPVLEYGNIVGCLNLKKHVLLLENVQGVSLRLRLRGLLVYIQNLDYEDRVKSLNLPSLEFRQTRGGMIETYKIIHGLHDFSCTSSFHIKFVFWHKRPPLQTDQTIS